MTTTHELQFGSGDVDEIGDGEGARCQWNETVCPHVPTRFVVFGEHSGGGEAQVFCDRHYVLTLARLHEVHVPKCSAPMSEHVVRYGALAEPG